VQAELGGRSGSVAVELDRFAALRKNFDATLEAALQATAVRAKKALAEGEEAYAKGRFRDARTLLVRASNLSVDDPARATRARERLERVAAYESAFADARAPFDRAVAAGDVPEAWRLGASVLSTLLDSDLTREILLPVPVATTPEGARVTLGDRALPHPTPAVVRYSPLGDTRLRLRAPGRVPWEGTLPSFADVRGGAPPHSLSVDLVEGPRWAAPLGGDDVSGPFVVDGAVYLLSEGGRRVLSVKSPDGSVADSRDVEASSDRIRALGTGARGRWIHLGHRSLVFVTADGTRWQYASVGRLDQPPAFQDGTIVLADEEGTVHVLDAETGRVRSKRKVESPPAQPPYASSLGVLLATAGGDVLAFSPKDGTPTPLVPRSAPGTRVLPSPDGGALVFGPGAEGARRVLPDRSVAPLEDDVGALRGLAPSVVPWIGPEGIAWVGEDGLVRWFAKGAKGPVRVEAAGRPAVAPVVDAGVLHAVDGEGGVVAVRLDAPTAALWRSRAGGPPASAPVAVGDLLLVRTGSALVGIER
jgi:hypothetical protein